MFPFGSASSDKSKSREDDLDHLMMRAREIRRSHERHEISAEEAAKRLQKLKQDDFCEKQLADQQ